VKVGKDTAGIGIYSFGNSESQTLKFCGAIGVPVRHGKGVADEHEAKRGFMLRQGRRG